MGCHHKLDEEKRTEHNKKGCAKDGKVFNCEKISVHFSFASCLTEAQLTLNIMKGKKMKN